MKSDFLLKFSSIRWKVVLYFILLIGTTVLFLWIFQIFFLDNFYEIVTTGNIKACAQSLKNNVGKDGFNKLASTLSIDNDVCMMVYNVDENTEMTEYFSVEAFNPCQIHNRTSEALNLYYKRAKNNNGEYSTIRSAENSAEFDSDFPASQMNIAANFAFSNDTEKTDIQIKNEESIANAQHIANENAKCIIHICLAKDDAGVQYMIMLEAQTTPINSIIKILISQLLIITSFFMLFGAMVAFSASKAISSPLESITADARCLADGDYSVKFKETGYLEAAQLAKTLNYAAYELSKSDSMQKELVANISHDLRTPLTMISGYAELMKDLPGEDNVDNLQIIIDEANRLALLVSDLMDISKIDSGTIHAVKINFCITDAIRSIFIRYATFIERDGYVILFENEADEDVYVNADKNKIFQVVYNLVNNAINYAGDDKEVIVRQKLIDKKVRIEVSDHGKGIPPEQIEVIWDRYYRCTQKHKTTVVGTGLGLSIVKRVLKLHQAEFGVESVVGDGSTFWFELPIAENPVDEA